MRSNKNVCITDTTYSLALYLLLMPNKNIQKTIFFLGDTIDDNIKNQLPWVNSIPTKRWDWKTSFKYRMSVCLSRICNKPTLVYAQDHICYADVLIGKCTYTLIEDAPGVYSQLDTVSFLTPFETNKGRTIKQRIKYYLSHTSIFGKTFGTNTQCICRLVTDPRDLESPYIKGKKYKLVSLQKMWEEADEEKKNYILDVFSISPEDIADLSSGDLLILTQPFMNDCQLTTEEIVALYQPYIEKYKNVVLKIHPRDHFDYLKYFPKVKVLATKAPMQLLNAMGINFPVALTVCSTALSAMPKETKKIYLGTKINEKIFNVYGDLCNK